MRRSASFSATSRIRKPSRPSSSPTVVLPLPGGPSSTTTLLTSLRNACERDAHRFDAGLDHLAVGADELVEDRECGDRALHRVDRVPSRLETLGMLLDERDRGAHRIARDAIASRPEVEMPCANPL